MKKAFCCWSGGKESCFSYYKADVEIVCLLNMVCDDGVHSRTHGISSKLLKVQAGAIGLPILQRNSSWETYEDEFKKAVLGLKKKGISVGVFGDIDLAGHREWVERVCQETEIQPILPLWQESREKLLNEFISVGFKAVVVTVKAGVLGEDWLAREIDRGFIEEMKGLENVDLCGENGEYHTFVYDGPIFKETVNLAIGRKLLKDGHWFLEIDGG